MTRRRVLLGAAFVVTVAAGCLLARPYVRALSFVVRAADWHGVVRRLADLDAETVNERELTLSAGDRVLRARAYEPAGGSRRTALVVPGLQAGGIDEPRMVRLSRALAASGVAVVTPEFPDLAAFAITPALTDTIEAVALDLARTPELAPDGRVALIGISFGGGPSIVAAGRPALRDRVAWVFVMGGYADLPRVIDHLSRAGWGTHDYGVALVLLGVADRLVPPEQVAALSAGVRRFLRASALDRVDPAGAQREFAALREQARTLPEPSATLLALVTARDVTRLGAQLRPHVGGYGQEPALSPSRSPTPSAPVFLLHGIDDPIIPSSESEQLAARLGGHAPVRLLLSGLLTHADAARAPRPLDVLPLVAFWADLLSR